MAEKPEPSNDEKIDALLNTINKRVAAITWTHDDWKAFMHDVHKLNPTRKGPARRSQTAERPVLAVGQMVECQLARGRSRELYATRHAHFIQWSHGLWCKVTIDGRILSGFDPKAIATEG